MSDHPSRKKRSNALRHSSRVQVGSRNASALTEKGPSRVDLFPNRTEFATSSTVPTDAGRHQDNGKAVQHDRPTRPFSTGTVRALLLPAISPTEPTQLETSVTPSIVNRRVADVKPSDFNRLIAAVSTGNTSAAHNACKEAPKSYRERTSGHGSETVGTYPHADLFSPYSVEKALLTRILRAVFTKPADRARVRLVMNPQ